MHSVDNLANKAAPNASRATTHAASIAPKAHAIVHPNNTLRKNNIPLQAGSDTETASTPRAGRTRSATIASELAQHIARSPSPDSLFSISSPSVSPDASPILKKTRLRSKTFAASKIHHDAGTSASSAVNTVRPSGSNNTADASRVQQPPQSLGNGHGNNKNSHTINAQHSHPYPLKKSFLPENSLSSPTTSPSQGNSNSNVIQNHSQSPLLNNQPSTSAHSIRNSIHQPVHAATENTLDRHKHQTVPSKSVHANATHLSSDGNQAHHLQTTHPTAPSTEQSRYAFPTHASVGDAPLYTQAYPGGPISPILVPLGLTRLLDSMQRQGSRSRSRRSEASIHDDDDDDISYDDDDDHHVDRISTHSHHHNKPAYRPFTDNDYTDEITNATSIREKRVSNSIRISPQVVEALQKHITHMAHVARTQSQKIRELESLVQASQTREHHMNVRHQREQYEAKTRIAHLEAKINKIKDRVGIIGGGASSNDAAREAKEKCRKLELELYKERLQSTRLRDEAKAWRQREASALQRHESIMARHVAGIRSVESAQTMQTRESGKLRQLYQLAAQRIETTHEHLGQLTQRLKRIDI